MFLHPCLLSFYGHLNPASPFWAALVPGMVTPLAVGAFGSDFFLRLVFTDGVVFATDTAARGIPAVESRVSKLVALVTSYWFC